MGWVKGTVVAAGVLLASAGGLAVSPQGDQQQKQELVLQKEQKEQEKQEKQQQKKELALQKEQDKRDKQQQEQEQEKTRRRERVVVTPQIEMFGSGARLGVSLTDVDEAAAKERKLPAAEGALVQGVEPGSAAEKAGIRTGDVITSFDGERVRSVRQLQRLVTDTPPGREVKLTLMRDGRRSELTVTPEENRGATAFSIPRGELRLDELERNLEGFRNLDRLRDLERLRDLPRAFRFEWDEQAPGDVLPGQPAPPRTPERPLRPRTPGWPLFEGSSGGGRLGVVVQELTPQLGEYFGAKEGVLVASVSEDSPAAQSGVKAGDVITTVNGKAVGNPDELLRMVRQQADGQEMSLGIVRDRKAQTLKVKLLPTQKGRPI